jgi:hypothetical protein
LLPLRLLAACFLALRCTASAASSSAAELRGQAARERLVSVLFEAIGECGPSRRYRNVGTETAREAQSAPDCGCE